MMKKYYISCFVSGAVWGLIAYVIGRRIIPKDIILLTLLPAPIIGVFIGYIYRRAYRLRITGRVFVSLMTLYIGTLLLGLSMGIFDASFHGGKVWAVILQGMFGMLYGITVYGFVVVLWPLAFVNHWIIGRIAKMT